MLSRPEVGTREHVRLWLAARPTDEAYEWYGPACPAGQYMQEFGQDQWPNVRELHQVAQGCHSFGELYSRLVPV